MDAIESRRDAGFFYCVQPLASFGLAEPVDSPVVGLDTVVLGRLFLRWLRHVSFPDEKLFSSLQSLIRGRNTFSLSPSLLQPQVVHSVCVSISLVPVPL